MGSRISKVYYYLSLIHVFTAVQTSHQTDGAVNTFSLFLVGFFSEMRRKVTFLEKEECYYLSNMDSLKYTVSEALKYYVLDQPRVTTRWLHRQSAWEMSSLRFI